MSRDPRLPRAFELLVLLLAFSVPLYRPWVTVAAPMIMILWLFLPDLRHRLRRLAGHGPTLAVLAFLLLNLLSLLWSSDPGEGLDYLTKYRYLLLVPVVATGLKRESREQVVSAFLAGAGLATVLTWLARQGVVTLGQSTPENPAVTMSHLDLSMILAVAALLALDRALVAPSTRLMSLWSAATLALASGLVANIGRSGQVAFAAGATALVAAHFAPRSRRASAVAVLTLWLLGIVVAVTVPRVGDRLHDARHEVRAALLDGDFESNQGRRLTAFLVASTMIRERPLLGAGIGGVMPRFRAVLDDRHPELAPLVRWFPHLHNQYLQVAAELGVVGLAALGLLLWQVGRGRPPDPSARRLGLLLAVAYALGFLGDPYLHKQLPLVAFALLAGLATSSPEPAASVE